MDICSDQPPSIFSLQQQVAFSRGPFSHLLWGMLLHSSMPPTAGRPWRNGQKHAIKKQGQNTWNQLLSLLTPRAPLFSPCTLSHPHPLPPFCSTAHTVYECMNRSISSCPTPSSLPTPQPLLPPAPHTTFSFYYHDNTQWGEPEGEEKSRGTRKRWTRGRERGALTSASIFKKVDDRRSGGLPWPTKSATDRLSNKPTKKKSALLWAPLFKRASTMCILADWRKASIVHAELWTEAVLLWVCSDLSNIHPQVILNLWEM